MTRRAELLLEIIALSILGYVVHEITVQFWIGKVLLFAAGINLIRAWFLRKPTWMIKELT